MIRSLFLCLLLYYCTNVQSQAGNIQVYYDENGNETSSDKATSYGIFYQQDGLYCIKKYSNKTKNIVSETWYNDSLYTISHGPYKSYYAEGNIQWEGWFSEGKREGIWKNYSSRGELEDSSLFKKGAYYEKYEFAFGKIFTATIISPDNNTVFRTSYYQDGSKLIEGRQNNSGHWIDTVKLYERDGTYYTKIFDDKGTLIVNNNPASLNPAYNTTPKTSGKSPAPITPSFPGGQPQFDYYVENRIQNPIRRRYKNLDIFPATSVSTIIFDSEGRVKDVIILQSVHPTIDAELRRALKNMPKWNMNGFIGAEFRLTYTLRIQ